MRFMRSADVSPMVAYYTAMTGAFIASDLTAFIAYSKQLFYRAGISYPDNVRRWYLCYDDLDGHTVEPEYLEVNWDVTAAQKEGYPHYMLKEIHEQPAAITRYDRSTDQKRLTGFYRRFHTGFFL